MALRCRSKQAAHPVVIFALAMMLPRMAALDMVSFAASSMRESLNNGAFVSKATFGDGQDPLSEPCFHVPATLCLLRRTTHGNVTVNATERIKESEQRRRRGETVVVTGGPVLPQLALSWTFDEAATVDASGHGHHLREPIEPGPGRWGVGHSAYFAPGKFATVPTQPVLESPHFTLSFWLFLVDHANGGGGSSFVPDTNSGFAPAEMVEKWRTVLRKGASRKSSAPGIFLWPHSRRLHVKFELRNGVSASLDSRANLPARQWHHVALIVDNKLVQLHINGILDAERVNSDSLLASTDPLYIGGDPWATEAGGEATHACLIDDFKIWRSGEVTKAVVLAESSGALGGLFPARYRLGCLDCESSVAAASCSRQEQPSFHACSLDEYKAGGLEVMRAQGWRWGKDSLDDDVWTAETLSQAAESTTAAAKRMSLLCCSN